MAPKQSTRRKTKNEPRKTTRATKSTRARTQRRTTTATRNRSKKARQSTRRTTKRERSIWHDSLQYLKESRQYIYAVIVLFFLSSFIGFLFPERFVFFNDLLAELSAHIDGLSAGELIWFIFQNNVSSAFFAMVAGILLGIMPLFNAMTNGVLLGYVFALASSEAGYGVIWYLVPHGVFELPAIFISLGLGVKLGLFIFSGRGKKLLEFRRRLLSSLKAFLTIVLPLLVIAAIIEGILIALV